MASPRTFGLRSRKKRRKQIDDILDRRNKQSQRRQYESVLPHVSLAKLYIKGKLRIEINLIFKPRDLGDAINFRAVLQAKMPSTRVEVHPSLASRRDPRKWIDLNRCARDRHASWYQKPVFISDVEMVEYPKWYVPSLVGFDRVENESSHQPCVFERGSDSGDSIRQVLPESNQRVGNRKGNGFDFLRCQTHFPYVGDKRVDHDVQTGPKIVNRISRVRAPFERETVVDLQAENIVSGLWVVVSAHEVWTALSESLGVGFEITNMSLRVHDLFEATGKSMSHG